MRDGVVVLVSVAVLVFVTAVVVVVDVVVTDGTASDALAPASALTALCPRISTCLSTMCVCLATWQAVSGASPVIITSCRAASLRCRSAGSEPSLSGVANTANPAKRSRLSMSARGASLAAADDRPGGEGGVAMWGWVALG